MLDLILNTGMAARAYYEEHAKGLTCKFVEADEIWSYIHKHERKVPVNYDGSQGWRGDHWLFSASCSDTKFIVS